MKPGNISGRCRETEQMLLQTIAGGHEGSGKDAGTAMLRARLTGCEDQGTEFVLFCVLEIVSTWFSFLKKSFKSIW